MRRLGHRVLLLALLFPACAFAGKPVSACFREVWTTREGLPHNQVNAIAQTISGGVADRTGLARYEKLVSRADSLLYEAKRAGRNRIQG